MSGLSSSSALSADAVTTIANVDELVDTLNSSLDVMKDALRQPATPDSVDFINNLMLEVKLLLGLSLVEASYSSQIQQNRDRLQARAEELVENGQFGSTDRIFEVLEQV